MSSYGRDEDERRGGVLILLLPVKYKTMEPTQLLGVKTNRPGASNSNVWNLDKGATVSFARHEVITAVIMRIRRRLV